MAKSSDSKMVPTENSENSISHAVNFHRLTLEIEKLDRKKWQFIVSWVLSSIAIVVIVFLTIHYQLVDDGDDFLYFLLTGVYLIMAGVEINRRFKVFDQKIDMLVKMVTLLNERIK